MSIFSEIEEEYWSTDGKYYQECTLDQESIACIVSEYVGNLTPTMPTGNVAGIHGQVPVCVYTFGGESSKSDYVYIAHYIYEVAHHCYLYRLAKEGQE